MSESRADLMSTGVAMDTPGARQVIPAARHRLRGADRSGLGQAGWAEVAADGIGDPDDTNVAPEYYEPASETDLRDQPV